MKNKCFLFSLLVSLLVNEAYSQDTTWSGSWDDMDKIRAQPIKPTIPYPDWSWMFGLKAGASFLKNQGNQTFYLAPGIEKTYAGKSSNNAIGNFSLLFGVQKILTPSFFGRFGIGLGFASSSQLNGNIWDDAEPQFNNFEYNYDLQHAEVTLEAKLLADMGIVVYPWISGSIGAGFNRATNFTSTPIVCGVLPIPDFTDNTTTGFTYSFGAGLEYALKENLKVGIGYEFAHWGNSTLGRTPEQTLNSGLSFNSIYTNGISLNLNYIV